MDFDEQVSGLTHAPTVTPPRLDGVEPSTSLREHPRLFVDNGGRDAVAPCGVFHR